MTKTNVYMFWLGGEYPKVMKENIKLLKNQSSINLIIGPSKDDHEELMKEYKYYRRAIKNKKYAFAKDLWSVWVQRKHGVGLALDAGGKIYDVEQFVSFCKYLKKINNYFVKETKYTIANCFFYTTSKAVIDGVLNFYKKNWWTRRIGPNILTRQVRKHIHKSNNWNWENIRNSIFAQIMEINNGETGYIKGGYGSWSSKNKELKRDDKFEVAWFVVEHSKWFTNKSWPNTLWRIGAWLKKLFFNY